MRGVTSMTPRGVDHFLEYLHAYENNETQKRPIARATLQVLREGEHLYTTLEHQALYAAWKIGSTSAEQIRQRFLQTAPQAKFTTVVLPYSYPLYQFRRESIAQPELGSSGRGHGHAFALTSRGSLLMQIQLVTQGGGVRESMCGGGSDPPLRGFRDG